MTDTPPLIASRFSFRRIETKDAPLGALILFQPPATELVSTPPNIAFGIVVDAIEPKQSPLRGVVWLGARYEFVPPYQVNAVTVIDAPWEIVPDVRLAKCSSSPQPGDLMVSQTGGMGLVHTAAPGRWGLLTLSNAVAAIWRADREALVMPWTIVSGDDVICASEKPSASGS